MSLQNLELTGLVQPESGQRLVWKSKNEIEQQHWEGVRGQLNKPYLQRHSAVGHARRNGGCYDYGKDIWEVRVFSEGSQIPSLSESSTRAPGLPDI